jgi:beta-lactamase class A
MAPAIGVAVACFIAIAFWLIPPWIVRTSEQLITAIAVRVPGFTPANPTTLKAVVDGGLENAQGTYGIVIRNLSTGESVEVNADDTFLAASLYKVWIMAVVHDAYRSGDIYPTEAITVDMADLINKYDIDPAEAQQAEGEITATAEEAIAKMITISDNNTALMLTDLVGRPAVSAFLERQGFESSSSGDGTPATTPDDMADFFHKLYRGELAGEDSTASMVAVLKKQELNYAIPKYLPKGTAVAHKTGRRETYTHDAGIVFGPGGPYVMVLMSDSGVPPDAEERMAKLARSVYDYFSADGARRERNAQITETVRDTVRITAAAVGILLAGVAIFIAVRLRKPRYRTLDVSARSEVRPRSDIRYGDRYRRGSGGRTGT